jgi:hypothetical protein
VHYASREYAAALSNQFSNWKVFKATLFGSSQPKLAHCLPAGVQFYYGSVDSATHAGGHSTVLCTDGTALVGSLVVDATGHSRKLVQHDKLFNPGKPCPQPAWQVPISICAVCKCDHVELHFAGRSFGA